MITVVLESPYAGNIAENTRYARACMHDCLRRNEAPFASHLLYTQIGVLSDELPEERALGIKAGLAIAAELEKTVIYTDLGISRGMQTGIENAERCGRPVEYRKLGKW
jgi:hypothetical protein